MPRLRPTLSDLSLMSNPLYTNDWLIVINLGERLLSKLPSQVRGFFSGGGSVRTFSLMASSVTLPNFQTNVGEVNLSGGFKIRYPMGYDHQGQVTVQFYDDQEAVAFEALLSWYNLVHELRSGDLRRRDVDPNRPLYAISRNFKAESLDVYLHSHAAVIDPDPLQVTLKIPLGFRLLGVWPSGFNFPDLSSSKQGEIFGPTVTFSYDHAHPIVFENHRLGG